MFEKLKASERRKTSFLKETLEMQTYMLNKTITTQE